MAISIETIVSIIAATLTASLIILNYVILRGSVRQNARSIELYEKNLKVSEETLKLNRSLLDENKKMIERQELDNRPKFIMKDNGIKFDISTGRPSIYLENIGGKGAHAKKIHVTITRNLISVVKESEIDRSVRSGAPLNIEIDLPALVIEYEVQRKDGMQLRDHETAFFSVNAMIEYTHTSDTDDADPFMDRVGFGVGNDYLTNEDYHHMSTTRMSSEKDTWRSLIGTGTRSSGTAGIGTWSE
ncbi:MAG: hypothetical protein FWD37_04665 [Methanomassiliicoccaceae archaeon]|nr:hypothetical protein [Methanomassiliicoccaceae archaeon]